jgi:uncharacterized protein (TIGR03067 family)
MSRRFVAAVLLLAVLSVVSPEKGVAGPPEAVPGKLVLDDVGGLQGTWRCVSAEMGGKHPDDAIEVLFVIEKETITAMHGKEVVWKATLRLNTLKRPKTIDLSIVEGYLKGKEIVGIYQLSRNSLKLCLTGPDKQGRPKGFMSNEGNTDELLNLRKEKP